MSFQGAFAPFFFFSAHLRSYPAYHLNKIVYKNIKAARMKKFLSVTLIFALAFLISCSFGASPMTDMLLSPYRCEISWVADGTVFCAEINSDTDSFSLLMTSPPEMAGLSLMGSDELLLYIDGAEAGSAPHLLSYIAELLRSKSSFSFLSRTDIDGRRALSYSRGEAIWYFSADDGRPIGFDDGSAFFKINWIEKKALQNENIDAYR